jgi:LuxR family transcriptional regulator, maltose regulon positive regulatory protein
MTARSEAQETPGTSFRASLTGEPGTLLEASQATTAPYRPWFSPAPFRSLTPRERDVLEAASRGLSTKLTGQSLGIAPETVKTHRESVLKKLRVPSTAAAVAVALREGWIS